MHVLPWPNDVILKNSFNQQTCSTPDFTQYKLEIQFHKLYNSIDYSFEWVCLNQNKILTSRQNNYTTHKSNQQKVGVNEISTVALGQSKGVMVGVVA